MRKGVKPKMIKKIILFLFAACFMLIFSEKYTLVLYAVTGLQQEKDEQPGSIIHEVEVRITKVDVNVIDKAGNRVTGLKAENFKLYEDGILQPLTNFYEVQGMEVFLPTTEKEKEGEKKRKKIVEDEFEHGNYEYLSYIVPDTLSKNLVAQNNYEIQRILEILPVTGAPGSAKFFTEAERIGREHSARYIITGKIAVKGKKMEVDIQFINIAARTLVPFIRESMETGAELKDIIVDISTEFKEKAAVIDRDAGRKTQEDTRRKADEDVRPDQSVSPFLKAYAFLGNLSFGVRGGRVFIKGAFSRVYEDPEYVGPYLSYRILNWLGFSASSDYLSADNGNRRVFRKTTLLLWGSSINADFSYWMFNSFGVQLSTGFGVSYSLIQQMDQSNLVGKLQARRKSIDPFLNLSASFKLFFRPVEIQFGAGYKSVFFRGRSLDLIAVFFSFRFLWQFGYVHGTQWCVVRQDVSMSS